MPSIDLSTVLKVHQKRVAGNAKFIAIHPFRKKRIREVMRYVGPRMIFIHPIAAIRHLISELK